MGYFKDTNKLMKEQRHWKNRGMKMLCKLRTAVQQQHTSAKPLYLNSFVGVRVCIRGNYGCVFLSMFASTQRLVCASLALSLVYRLFAVKGVLMILNH